jgi:ferredoxin
MSERPGPRPRPRPGGPRPAPGRRIGWPAAPGRPAGPFGPAGPQRLHIDWTACDGRGLCVELLPELLDRDQWGFPRARDGARDPAIPPPLRAHAQRAVASCPMLALSLVP